MNSEQKTVLNALLNDVPYALELYGQVSFDDDELRCTMLLENLLHVIEVFINQKEAQAVTKLIRQLIDRYDYSADEEDHTKHHKEHVAIFKDIMEQGEELRVQIEKA